MSRKWLVSYDTVTGADVLEVQSKRWSVSTQDFLILLNDRELNDSQSLGMLGFISDE